MSAHAYYFHHRDHRGFRLFFSVLSVCSVVKFFGSGAMQAEWW
jgi:hypothetical protein